MSSEPSPEAEIGSSTMLAWLETDEQAARSLAGLLAECLDGADAAVSLVDKGGGGWRVTIHFQNEPDRERLRALAVLAAGPAAAAALCFERVATRDWTAESLGALTPVEAGRFVVFGAHDRGRIPLNRIGIEVEAALAFGTGHHGTTRGCLLALDRILKARRRGPGNVTTARRDARILDFGTGSGVLAIAAARALRQPVLAIDIDPNAVRAARENIKRNRAAHWVALAKADGIAALHGQPFDLAFANILLEPLQRLAAPLTKITAPGGRVILSGLLASQANAALAAYRALPLERRIELDGWTTLVLKRPARRPDHVGKACPRLRPEIVDSLRPR